METPLSDSPDGTTSISATKRIIVKLGKQGAMDFVDSKIFVVDGCAVGLLGLGYHPIVLSVCPNTLEFHGVHIGDGLCHIDGMDTRDIDQSSMWRLIHDASSLGFQRGPEAAVSAAAMQSAPSQDTSGEKNVKRIILPMPRSRVSKNRRPCEKMASSSK
jgi:hypothetical protein